MDDIDLLVAASDAITRRIDAEILDYARRAATKGKELAVGPPCFSRGSDKTGARIFSIKHDTLLVAPGEPIPIGWRIVAVPRES